jgi:RNA polymerase sigma-70 factor (ECF subfamily)
MSETRHTDLGQEVPRMYRVALRMVGSAEAAQEVVQEACLRALRRLSAFDGRSQLSTWVHRITVNCAVDHLRSRQRGDAGEPLELAGLTAAGGPSPADRAERSEMFDMAMEQLHLLPDDCRTAFILTQLDGYSYDQVARIENRPRGTIASRVSRAKKILLEQLNSRLEGRCQP